MRILALVSVAVATILPVVDAAVLDFDFGPTIFAKLNKDLTSKNHYGSPIPPWKPGSKPGWYYGPHPGKYPGIPCLNSVRGKKTVNFLFSALIQFSTGHLRLAQVLPWCSALPT